MTTEDDFQNAIDAQPEDWQTRLVFADWLEDRGDPRAAGYRAIAIQQRRPLHGQKMQKDKDYDEKTQKRKSLDTWWWHCPANESQLGVTHNNIPRDWFDLLPEGEGSKFFWPVHSNTKGLMSRWGCEDALALAFAELPAVRQAELLIPPAQLAKLPAQSETKQNTAEFDRGFKARLAKSPAESETEEKPKKRKKK